ncbi:hypothetical protein ABDD95_20640 [Mucilaginibacter sp. PAMB04274]|uniref:hypothetical protein n=1 Tax=Mucilaginibacter sp. PAMB04274 TaxID=3138568 RepID=UPI0031F6F9E6
MKQSVRIILVVLISVHGIACNEGPKHVSSEAKQTDTVESKTTVQETKTSDENAFPAYTDPVYKSYISATLKALIEEKLPGWRLPPSGSWEKYWFNAYKKADALVDYASGDFNGDGKADYALLLENENHAFIVWVLQSQHDGYKAVELTQLNETTLPLDTGLELVGKGKLNHLSMDDGVDGEKTMELQHPAIQVSYFEASAEIYYWKDNKFQSVTTGD